MNNYVYIVAGFPELALNFDGSNFSFEKTKDYVVELLSDKDQELVALLEEGFDEAMLGSEFYAKAAASGNRFIREYFDFDARLRDMKVIYLAKRLHREADAYLVEMPESDFDDAQRIRDILDNPDFVAREQQMDLLKWNKVSEITLMNYFDMDAILAFLVKAKMVQRWAELDTQKGEEMFHKLVGEVRGTFKGVENELIKD